MICSQFQRVGAYCMMQQTTQGHYWGTILVEWIWAPKKEFGKYMILLIYFKRCACIAILRQECKVYLADLTQLSRLASSLVSISYSNCSLSLYNMSMTMNDYYPVKYCWIIVRYFHNVKYRPLIIPNAFMFCCWAVSYLLTFEIPKRRQKISLS